MNTTLKKNQILDSGFKILDVVDLPEFQSKGIWAIHQKTGAEVFHLLNDDTENFFSFIFNTPSEFSFDTAHILEHMVFCGSKSYPVKDPLKYLNLGSLITSSNGLTGYLNTFYFSSSLNEQDYFNSMLVFGDAVFNPLLTQSSFMQEGYHYYFEPKGANKYCELKLGGIVFNETNLNIYNSIYSDYNSAILDSILLEEPYDYNYKYESILDTNWNKVNEYHLKWYTPSNCRIFLYGNIPTEKQLAVLNENIFSSMSKEPHILFDKKKDTYTKPKKWKEAKLNKFYTFSDKKPAIIISWYCGDSANIKENFELNLLKEILTKKENSDFFSNVKDYKIISDIFTLQGGEDRTRELIFNLFVEINLDSETEYTPEKISNDLNDAVRMVFYELRNICKKKGISKDNLKKIIYQTEFGNRKISRNSDGYPFSYDLMDRSNRSWRFNKQPWDSLNFIKSFNKFKKHINKYYVKKLINKFLLKNNHILFTEIEPNNDIKEINIKDKLAEIQKNLTQKDKEIIQEKAEELKIFHEKEDDPRHAAKIPHISLKEINPEIDFIKREYTDINGVPVIINPIYNNEISYIHIAFPVDVLEPQDYIALPLFAEAIKKSGIIAFSPEDVNLLIKRNMGSFSADLEICPCITNNIYPDIQGREWIVFSVMTLDKNIGPALHLARMIIQDADFSCLDKPLMLIPDLDIEMEASSKAYFLSGCNNSRSRVIIELWDGMNQYNYTKKIERTYRYSNEEEEKKYLNGLKVMFQNLKEKIINSGAIINITGNNAREAIKELKFHFGWLTAPKPFNPMVRNNNNFNMLIKPNYSYPKVDVFHSTDLRSGICALSFRPSQCGSNLHPAEQVLAHLLKNSSFYENLRLKGGAYVVDVSSYNSYNSFHITTDRDPNPLKSLEFITEYFKTASAESLLKSKSDLEKAIIGTIAQEIPKTPMQMGYNDFTSYLTGIKNEDRLKRRSGILNVTPQLLDEALKRFASQLEDYVDPLHPVIIAGGNIPKQIYKKTGIKYRKFGEEDE